jgi:hypothetical protein
MFASTAPPVIDTKTGGSGLEYPKTLATAADSIKNVDTIITGHDSVRPWKDLRTYAEFTQDFRDAVVNGFHHGLGVTEIAAGWSLPPRFAGYTAPPDRVRADIVAIVGELSR